MKGKPHIKNAVTGKNTWNGTVRSTTLPTAVIPINILKSYLYKLIYSNPIYSSLDLIHIVSLTQEDGTPLLNRACKDLIGVIVFPTWK